MANSTQSNSPAYTRWCEYLAGAPKPTFPRTHEVAAVSAPSALRRKIMFPRKRLSPYSTTTIIRAAWALVNAHYSDFEDDVVFGFVAPISEDYEDQDVSYTALPSRFHLDRSQNVVDLLRSIQDDSIMFSSSHEVTLDGIKALGSSAQGACTFQNQLIIHEDMITSGSVELDRVINVECTLTRQGAIVQTFYDPTTIETKQMHRIMDLFDCLSQQLCGEISEKVVGDLHSTSRSDLQEIQEWNKTVPEAKSERMHDLIYQKVLENPDAEAVSSFEGDFTYRMLDDMSTRLARHLLSKGIGPGNVVPFMFEKSAWTIFAMLAVLKTGAAFVPLDTAHSWTDTAALLESCDSKLVLCSPMYADRFRQRSVETVVVQRSSMDTLPAAGDQIVSSVTPEDAAYVIFTSGSTGKPKGIVCSHQAWCTNAIAHGAAELITPESRCLQFSAYTFDISLSDIFTTLVFGGCVCVPSDSERLNDLAGAMRRMRVNQAALTPTVAKFLKPADVPELQVLKIGGESMSPEFVAKWAGSVQLMNSYGPAECTSRCSCTWTTTSDDPTVIGKALGSVLWVTQPENPHKLAPIGAVGELLVEGPILASGYLNDPDRTESAFIDSPEWLTDAFPDRVGKVYRTGDLVQYTTDGRLRFIGRRDTQIKFNGIRLECGDIESKIIAQAPDGYQAVVDKVVVAGRDQKPLLAAFICPPQNLTNGDPGSNATVEFSGTQRSLIAELRQNLLGCMPTYMTPQLFIPLTSIPLGATGKINRRALQILAGGLTEEQVNQCTATEERVFEAPVSAMQKTLCKLWAEVLRVPVESISSQDIFFKMGGDSVTAMQLVAAARELDITLTVSDIFQTPKLSDLAQLLETSQTSDDQEYDSEPFALVGGVSRGLRDQLKKEYRIPTPLVEDVYPCTPIQEAVMAETMSSPEAYILQEVLRIPNHIDIEKLEDAWETVVQETPILRSRIVLLDKLGTCQVVLSEIEPIVWQSGTNVSSYLQHDKKTHMSYGDVLSRFAILHTSDGDRFLVWTTHHAITDGWMHTTVLDQVKRVYNNQPVQKGPSFNGFIKYLAQQKGEKATTYWQSQFESLEPTRFPDWDSSYQPTISQTMDRKIAIARGESGFTTAILLRAAWSLILAQQTSTTDIVFGITQAGRDIPLRGIEKCFGPTLTTVPVPVSVNYQETVVEFLTRLQNEFVEMIPFQHTGLQNIKRISQQCAAACGFHNLLVVQPAVEEDPSFLTRHDSRNAGEELGFGLLMECYLGVGEIILHAGFDTNVISGDNVSRILCQLESVLQQLSTQSKQTLPLGHIDLLGSRDSQDLISWNGEQPELTNNCMHWMIERQVLERPDAPAVDSWDAQFSYGELDRYANRLAGHLVHLGVGPETIVPFIFEKSAWAVVAILATLKAGGASVALDDSHPSSRHKKIIADADARVILASSVQAQSLDLGVHVVSVDKASLEALPNQGLPANYSGAGPRNAAFVVYSSGSTGTPKGTVLEHASLCATSRTNSEHLSMGTSSRVIQFASYAFDVAIEENVITLMYGSCICIPSSEERLNDLSGAMKRLRVTWADLTPTVARMLDPDDIPSLKTLVVGGESLSQDIIDVWADRVDLINTYGPSECSIQATASKKLGKTARGANIGSPVNCRLWIVDAEDHNRLQPVGCVGELLIEGEIVGRGYLKEPEKTRSVFIQDPVWAVSESSLPRRFYKTGDLAKYNEDGTLSCLGRKDTQIKLHGQRIELGEIEHSLKVHSRTPDDTQVVVEAFTPSSNKSRKLLIAFLLLPSLRSSTNEVEVQFETVSDSTRAELMQLKDSVSQALPEYMVPSFFAPLNKLPTNTSGKTDRKQLRAMAEDLSRNQLSQYSLASTTKAQASTGVERKLQELWANVLNINTDTDPISANDGFLQLGGDSITAMQLVGKARKVGLHLSVSDIFQSPKLADMAAVVKQIATESEEVVIQKKKPTDRFQMISDRIPIKDLMKTISSTYNIDRDMVQDVYPCTPLQEGLMALTAEDSGAYVLQDVFELPQDIDIDQFKTAWAAVVRETPILRTRIAFIEGVGSCQVVVDGRIKWRKSTNLSECLEKDRAKPMKYGKPLSRYTIVEDGPCKKFVWTIHHALYDGYSYNLTLEKVHHAYENDLSVPQSVSYSSFIQYLNSVDPETSSQFWRQQLDGVETMNFPQLPAGHQPQAGSILDHTISFDRKSNTGITTSSLLRAAWSLLVSSYSGCKDVVFGVTQSGRDVPLQDVESIVGPTITTVPVRVQIPDGVEVRQFLNNIQDQTTAMIPYAHTGLQNIKRLSESAQLACGFQNLLVIQPSAGDDQDDSIFASHEVVAQAAYLKSFGVVLECGLADGEINICAHYDSTIIPLQQMQRILYQFEHILSQLSSEKGLVDSIEVFSPQDKQELVAWNTTYPEVVSKCIHQIIQQQAKYRPTAAAVVSRQDNITYVELDQLTTHLAHTLQDLQVGPETLVPICIEKSPQAIIAMLAIQKAGGAFVPLNPKDPVDRLQDLIDQTEARHIIVTKQTKHLVEKIGFTDHVVELPSSMNQWYPLNTAPINSQVKPSNTAYALFTSGSTGRPKAVVIEHKAVSSSTAGHGEAMGFNLYPRRVLQFATYTFDACIAEIFTTLTHGGCVCVPSESERMDDIVGFIDEFNVDWAFFTPSFVQLIRPESVPSLKTVVLGGEAMTQENVDVWGSKALLMNGYGPTETCIFCVTHVASPQGSQLPVHKPETIGRAVSSISWVVEANNHNRLVPIGCAGELLVQGPSLARGYLKDPTKTAEVFIESPEWLQEFGYSQPQMLYKTGDLVRYNSDGTITYLGRKDNQVKVNGQRLELGEIEDQLAAKSPAGSQVIVVAGKPKCQASKQTLAAFLCFDSNECKPYDDLVPMSESLRSTVQDLEFAMRQILPGYMVPSLWIPMGRIPTTVSGKTDRKALGALLRDMSSEHYTMYSLAVEVESNHRAPSTDLERRLQKLIAKILAKDPQTIGADDSFFRLGGDSISGIQLVAAARADGLTLTTEDIFRQPKISDMAKIVKTENGNADITDEPIAPFSLLESDSQESVLDSVVSEYNLPKGSIEDILPCTPLQEGLIALTTKDPEAYVLRDIFRLPRDLEIDRFKAAWEKVIKDSAILRTRIVTIYGRGSFQVVMKDGITWKGGDDIKTYVADDMLHPFRYGFPLARLAIVDSKWDGRYFVWTIHHSLYDGWSYGLMLEQVQQVYHGLSPKPTPPFNKFIKYLEGIDQEACDTFWREQFASLEARQFPRKPSPTFEPVLDKSLDISIPITRKQNSSLTMSTILKGAWAVLLSRYTGAQDALFGVTQTGRNAPVSGITEMVGPTIATVPLRVALDHETSITNFLEGLQSQTTDMIRYEHAGLQNIQRLSPQCREACAFSNILVIQPDGQSDLDFLGTQKVRDLDKNSLGFGLGIECILKSDSIFVTAGFDGRLIQEEQMKRMLHQFQAAIQQLNLELPQTIGDIMLFSPEDKAELLSWNADMPERVDECAHDVIQRRVQVVPGATAVNAWDVDLTYWELDSLSTKLAHCLRAMGIGPGYVVPLCFEKSGWSVVAILAVMKAGGAFVFLDPAYPMARLQEIVNQVEAKHVLTSLKHAGLWRSKMEVMIVDQVSIESLPSHAQAPQTEVTPRDALYVIFTSGSTGKPKGCVVEHSSFLTGAKAQAECGSMTSSSRVLQIASYSFDVSILEIITALTVGACICVPNERAKSRSIATVINNFQINWAFLTPSVVKLIKPEDVPNLRTLILGGEALSTHDVETWAEHIPQLVNGYGPSECSIAAAGNPHLTRTTDPANIGRAIGGICWITEAHDHNRLAPIGTIGELLIEGPIVARGYLNNPEKTDEVFIENPAWVEKVPGQPPRRLYKTGDLVHYNPDGTINFIGRKDNQVKVRGQRLELGEIESHLSINPEIGHSMILYPGSGPCKAKLVAVLTLKELVGVTAGGDSLEIIDSESAETASGIITELSQKLARIIPAYMIPNIWIVVKGVPFLPSGKMNRKRIDQWIGTMDDKTYHKVCGLGNESGGSIAPPSTIMEGQLQKIWSTVLRLPIQDIGVKHSFTTLGGDSISAMQVVAQCRKEGINISLQQIFQCRTISLLAQAAKTGSDAPAAVEEKTNESFDLSPIQQFYADFTLGPDELSKSTNARFNHSFCLHVKKPLQAADLARALDTLVGRHSMLRARFQTEPTAPSGWRQFVTDNVDDSLHFCAWNNITLDQARPCLEEARIGLDIENGPICAADLVTVDQDTQYLFIVAHHLVVDMVSWNVILRDLEEILSTGSLSSEKPFPFSTWSKLQKEYASEHLKPEVVLPVNIPRADFSYWGMQNRSNLVRDIHEHSFTMPAQTTTSLLTTCNQTYGTEPMDILVSTLSHAFSFVFKDRAPPTIFKYNHGREPWTPDIDVSQTVGWFSTLSPIHVPIRGKEDSISVLRRTISTRRKIPNNGYNYFCSRYLHPEGIEAFESHDEMEVSINYLGCQDGLKSDTSSLFELPTNFEGGLGAAGQEVKCFSLFSINASVEDGKLGVHCVWNKHASHQESIRRWFRVFERLLQDVANRSLPRSVREAQGLIKTKSKSSSLTVPSHHQRQPRVR